MQLIFLHGAPASGKLTVARALMKRLPARLLDNHAAIDMARTVFDFGAPGFWSLVHTVREAALRAAIEHDLPLLIVTLCYAEADDRAFFDQLTEAVTKNGGRILPVYLHCSYDRLLQRIGNADRVERGKAASAAVLANFLSRYEICRVPRADCLSIDTGEIEADDAASLIIRHFNLA